ncbi:hypothetical protein [Ulvibacter litoralis]|uniref:WD40-like Beta Propeller Repeat n=1 Tax=Ulvibacter litoralis TaxID=227084 RepID=A0A1G7F1D5_9FLAO|nr:hypothetical protein [Ulvibacter litoralis]GHC53061.1 hypothetical protein GCM10008083_16290 [Ulvibacter litoralis]SDE69729.1 hypothetical protein SAMN05421855_102270 [Ulvibacter litoralis]
MNKIIATILLGTSCSLFAQTNPEVYLGNVKSEYGGLAIYNFQNISNDAGYDNQPSFVGNSEVLFAGNNTNQTDITTYSIATKTKNNFYKSTPGGEYSPKMVPNKTNVVSAVRLDPDGLQRLYFYEKGFKNPSEAIKGLQVAYYDYYDDNTLVASVLRDDELDLVVSKLKSQKTDTLVTNVGRSISKVPNSNTISYTLANKDKNQELFLLNMETYESFFVCQLPVGIQDYAWLNDSQILIGSNSKIYLYDTFLNEEWSEVADLSEDNITNITRLAVSPNQNYIAIVAEPND